MVQIDFLLESLRALKGCGIHTAVDTSGYTIQENFIKIIPYTDLFLYDLKHMDTSEHLRLTGVSNELILENYRLIAESGCDFMVRIPVIPGLNDDESNLSRLRSFILHEDHSNLRKISLLPFHKIGASKYKRFDMIYRMEDTLPPSSLRMKEIKEYFHSTGIKVKIGG